MKRIGWAATALVLLHPLSQLAIGAPSPSPAASPTASPSPTASASPAPGLEGALKEEGDFISVKTPWDATVEARLNELLQSGRKALGEAKAKGTKVSYEESFLAWDAMCGDIDEVSSFASWEFNTSPDQGKRDKSEKTEELVGKLTARLYTLRMPYEVLKASHDHLESGLSWDRKAYAKDVLRAFEHNGVHLEGAPKARVQEIDNLLIQIGTRFGKVLKDRDVYIEVTEAQAKACDKDAIKPDPKTGKTSLVLREDTYLDVMRRHPDREFRKACYSRFFEGTLDQTGELDQMRKLREEKAKLVKNTTYAALELDDEGFTQAEVRATLMELKTRTQTRFDETMKDYLSLNAGVAPRSYDLAFLEERAPTAGVDPRVLLEYISAPNVVKMLLSLSKKLYGLDFQKKGEDANRVQTYEVKDRTGKVIGSVILDLFPRSNKYSHAACWTMRGRASHYPQRTAAIGLAANLHEKDLDGGGKGILLDEAETLFHEFGHVLHGLLINTESIGGHSCPRSLVEVPSQVFENWAFDPAVLDEMAVHYKTGKTLPPDLRNVLYRKSMRFAARHLRTQTLYALFDLDFHEKTSEPAQAIWDRLAEELYGADFYPRNVPWFTRFGHLDGYGAKYWGYKFADLGKSQIYWNLVHRFRDLQSAEVGRQMEDRLLVFGGLKKLPQVAPEFTGVRLIALPYVLETLVDYQTLRTHIAAEAAKGKDYKAALEAVFSELLEKTPPTAPTPTDKPGAAGATDKPGDKAGEKSGEKTGDKPGKRRGARKGRK